MTRYHRVVDLRKKRTGPRVSEQRELPLPVGSPRRRRASLRTRRRRVRLWTAASALCGILLLMAAASYVSYLPRFNVQTVEVAGAGQLLAQDIAQYADSLIHAGGRSFFSKSNIFLYQPAKLAQAVVSHFPVIRSAQVSRRSLFATVVQVTVQERAPFARYCSGDASSSMPSIALDTGQASACYEMDSNGFIFANDSGANPATPYVFTGALQTATGSDAVVGSTYAPGHFEGLLALLKLLNLDGFAPGGASVRSDDDFTVPLSSGYYLKASFGENADDLAKNVQLVLTSDVLANRQNDLEYIDLRFGDRVYYKFKDSAAPGGTVPLH